MIAVLNVLAGELLGVVGYLVLALVWRVFRGDR